MTPALPQTFAYDVLQYPSLIFPQMHPSRLAAIGRLHGLAAASPKCCRLLEIGCGDGLQLLTLAQAYPQSHFIGVDLSQAAIARGEALRTQLGLSNLQLHAVDVCQWDAADMMFDYVVAHGFFSWVPPPVQDALLMLCQQRLSPAGIAYISYNALPGCQLRRLMWGMLGQHTAGIHEPEQKIAQAREFLMWLGTSVSTRGPYADVVRHEAQDLLNKTESSVFYHDDLAEWNQPYSITEFAARVQPYGLRFLAEADYHDSSTTAFSEATIASLAELAAGDVIRHEQYLDYLKGRRFRQTLLCRADATLQRAAQVDAVAPLHVVGQLQEDASFPDSELGKEHPDWKRFHSRNGAAMIIDNAGVASALSTIGHAYPLPMNVATLHAQQPDGLSPPAAAQEHLAHCCTALLAAFRNGLVTLHCDPPTFAATAGERPRLNRLSRLQLEQGHDMLASLRPSLIRLDSPLAQELARLLDGQRDRAALLQALAERMQAFPVPVDGNAPCLQPLDWWQQHLASQLEDGLQLAAHMALLDASD